MNLTQILLILVTLFSSFSLYKSPNPSDLFHTNENEHDDSDDGEVDSSKLFNRISPQKTISSPKPRTADFHFHLHLAKIIWNKIRQYKTERQSVDSSIDYPLPINMRLHLTREMEADIDRYVADVDNSSDSKHQAQFNTHILNHLEIVHQPARDNTSFYDGPMEKWYETKWFLYSVAICLLSSFVLTMWRLMSKWSFVLLIIVFCIALKGFELYEEHELTRSQIIAHEIPKHCGESKNYWVAMLDTLGLTDRRKECLRSEKAANKKSIHNANLFRVIPALISDVLTEVCGSVGLLVGRTYDGLRQHLPWYLTPVFLIVLIMGPFVFLYYLVIYTVSAWWAHRATKHYRRQHNHNNCLRHHSNSSSTVSTDEIEYRNLSTNKKRDRIHFVLKRPSNYGKGTLRIKNSK